MKFRTAYDIIAHILGLQPAGKRDIYIKKDSGKKYRRTRCGFEPVEKHNLKIEVLRLGHKMDTLKNENEELRFQNENLIRKTEGLRKQLALSQENGKKFKKEKGFLNKLLKEVLDKNLSLDKKYDRLLKSKENTDKQLENLKLSKAHLLEQYNSLIEKNRDQKKHLQELQNVIIELKKK